MYIFGPFLQRDPGAHDGSGKRIANSSSSRLALAAFVLPNRPIDPRTPIASFAVPLEALESAAGLNLFPAVVDGPKKEAGARVESHDVSFGLGPSTYSYRISKRETFRKIRSAVVALQ